MGSLNWVHFEIEFDGVGFEFGDVFWGDFWEGRKVEEGFG